jgi:hypothetical protein
MTEKAVDSGTLKFVGSYTTRQNVEEVMSLCARIGITGELRNSASNWSDYLGILSRRADNAGILVMRSGVVANLTNRKLKVTELQGFAVSETRSGKTGAPVLGEQLCHPTTRLRNGPRVR